MAEQSENKARGEFVALILEQCECHPNETRPVRLLLHHRTEDVGIYCFCTRRNSFSAMVSRDVRICATSEILKYTNKTVCFKKAE